MSLRLQGDAPREMAQRIASLDWRSCALGSAADWPSHLKLAVQLMLDTPEPVCILWGPDAILFYNDAYVPLLFVRHPAALGRSFAEVWPGTAHSDSARCASVLVTGSAVVAEGRPFIVSRGRAIQEAFFDFSAAPIRSPDGRVDGVFQRLSEVTNRVNAERRSRYLESVLKQHQSNVMLQLVMADAIIDDREHRREEVESLLENRVERLQMVMVAGRLATLDWDIARGDVEWSDQMYKLCGYEQGEVEPGFGAWTQRVHADDLEELLAQLELARDRQKDFIHRFRIRHPTGAIRWCAIRGRYFYDDAGHPHRMLAVMQDVTDDVNRETRLREAERRQRAVIEGVPQLMWSATQSGAWTWSSPQWARYTGRSAAESVNHGWLLSVHPDDRRRVEAAWEASTQTKIFDTEYRIAARTKEYRWFKSRAIPFQVDLRGKIEWFGTSTDIDDLRRAREVERMLLGELQHRTRNLIGIVQSIAQTSSSNIGSLADFLPSFVQRLGALARVQGLVSRTGEQPATLEDLIWMEIDALTTSGRDRCEVTGPVVRLMSSVVQPLALAIHELTTNALKHGALGGDEGRVRVSWRIERSEPAQPKLLLQWLEFGLQIRTDTARARASGYGREMLEHMLPYAVDALVDFRITDSGMSFKMEMPLDADFENTMTTALLTA
jgi:PAS domain S-box-containing protein